MKKGKTGRSNQYTVRPHHEDDGIASTAVMRFRTARPYVLMAHMYVLTRCSEDDGKCGQERTARDGVTLTQLLKFASAMVMSIGFRRRAVTAMLEAENNDLISVVGINEAGEAQYKLTEDGMCFLRTGHKRRLALQNRKPNWMPEDVCQHCAEDEINEWVELIREERTRNAFGDRVSPTEFVDKFILGVRERIIYRCVDVPHFWAGLVIS